MSIIEMSGQKPARRATRLGLAPEIAQFAERFVAGAVGGGRAHNDVGEESNFQKLAGAE